MKSLELAKQFAWLLRSDVRGDKKSHDLPHAQFEQWWMIQGRAEYPYWSSLTDVQKIDLFAPVGKITVGTLELQVPKSMQLVLSRRTDVMQKFSIDKKIDPNTVAAWFWTMGVGEHLLTPAINLEMIRQLDRPVFSASSEQSPAKMEAPAPSVLMRLAWNLLPLEMHTEMSLEDSQGRYQFLSWFFCVAQPLFRCQALIANRWKSWLLQELAVNESTPELGVLPRFVLMEYGLLNAKQRPDITSTKGVSELFDWSTKALMPGSKWAWLKQKIQYQENGLPIEESLGLPKTVNLAAPNPAPSSLTSKKKLPFGVNLFGFAYGELGVGEDVRMAAKACEAAGIAYRIVNIEPGTEVRQSDLVLEAKVKQSLQDSPYAINVFCMPGFDMVARVFLKLGEAIFQDHYNIGWWPWELGVWPATWDKAFGLIDELWAGSQFSHQMYEIALLRDQAKSGISRSCSPMPLAVSIDQIAASKKIWNKKKFGLPEKAFLFLYVFDFGSHLERKNPMAAIEAFSKAFGIHSKPSKANVGLVFKVMNVKEKDPSWIEFQKHCTADKRIHILNQTLDREAVLGLISCCDAYLSPHRAEGFGRTLAEAMLFGKPVVATNYSGNQFFMDPTVTLPVDFELVPVKAGQYHFIEDIDQAVWANPLIDHMAQQMQVAIQKARDPDFVELLKGYAQQTFAPMRTGDLMKNRLDRIWNHLNQDTE